MDKIAEAIGKAAGVRFPRNAASATASDRRMRAILALAALLIAAAGSCAPAMAAEACPVSDAAAEKAGGFPNAVEAALKAAPDCEKAYETLAACQLGSSADVALADIVQSKCEPLFMEKASTAAKAAYKKGLARCNTIAEKNQGTMYRGLAAVCQAKAARDFARKYSAAH